MKKRVDSRRSDVGVGDNVVGLIDPLDSPMSSRQKEE